MRKKSIDFIQKNKNKIIFALIAGLISLLLFFSVHSRNINIPRNENNHIVNLTNEKVVISYYQEGNLRARFTKNLADDPRDLSLFLPRCAERLGVEYDVSIIANAQGEISYIEIEDSVFRCDDQRNQSLCNEAGQVFNSWCEELDIENCMNEAMQLDESFFNFGPYYPAGGEGGC